jgi:hypothetical protein
MAFDSLDAYMSEYAGEEEGEGDWRSLFVKIIGQVCATEADSVEPCEAAEYLADKAIMGSLERAFRAAGVETSGMQTILETFWEFENQPERGEWEVRRDIEAAYERTGMVDVLVARWMRFYEC